jgi:hypothetical protein
VGGTDTLPAAENHDAMARISALAETMRERGGLKKPENTGFSGRV